jgi:hypothetical protein
MRYQLSTVQHSHRHGPRLAAVALSVCCFALSAGVAVGQPVPSSKAAPPRNVFVHGTGVDKYLGMWNYDEPDLRTMTDIAVITCPPAEKSCAASPPLELPQIGFVLFSPGPHGSVVGRTDQGCTWYFVARPHELVLSPPGQYCFNHVVGSGYTMTRWSVTVSGEHEQESIDAISYLGKEQYDFVLQNGRRTRVSGRPSSASRFSGDWSYEPADPGTGLNIETTVHAGPSEQVAMARSDMSGYVAITSRGSQLEARAPDGCRWGLVARGNTAELQPRRQTCVLGSSTETLTFWSIESTGNRQVSIMAGTDGQGSFLLGNGGLTRRAS